MGTKNKHYATRMKERIAELENEVRNLVLFPESYHSQQIKTRVFHERDIENAIWAGDSTIRGGGDGILPQMFTCNCNKPIDTVDGRCIRCNKPTKI